MKLKMILLLLGLSGMAGCVQEMKDIVIDSDPKLVVECYLNPADARINVVVNQNRPILGEGSGDRGPGDAVTKAKVVLSSGNQKVTLPYDAETNSYHIPTRQFKLVVGRTYTLEVSATGFPNASASCTIPKLVSVLTSKDGKLTYVAEEKNVYKVYRQRSLSWVNTQANQTGYYLVGNGVGNSTRQNANGKDTTVIELSKTSVVAFLTDSEKSNKNFSTPPLDFLVGEAAKPNDTRIVSEGPMYTFVYNVDANYYQFMESVKLQREVGDNPFTEAVPIYSNIKNGLGIFGACVVHVKKL